ncbi:unnamed protein product [Aphanomyces euteiches]
MDSHGNLHLLVAARAFTESKVNGYAIKLIEQTSLTAANDAAQCQKIDKIKDSLHGEIKSLSDGIPHLRAPRTLVTLTAKPSLYSLVAPLVWREDDIGQSKSLCDLVRGSGSAAGQFALLLDGNVTATSQSNGPKQHFAHLFKLDQVGIIKVKLQARYTIEVSSFDLTVEEME